MGRHKGSKNKDTEGTFEPTFPNEIPEQGQSDEKAQEVSQNRTVAGTLEILREKKRQIEESIRLLEQL